jgi:regulatory protein
MLQKKRLTPQQALIQLKQYCAYQERSHWEVKEKLFGCGIYSGDADQIISQLIEEDYLNEERFAQAFARGKFRMKHWGRIKILYELKQKKVSEYCIKKGLREIDGKEYHTTFAKLADEKWRSLKGEKNIHIKKRKLADYLTQKGFERDLIFNHINEHSSNE